MKPDNTSSNPAHSQQGLTIIELLACLVLASLLGLGAYQLLHIYFRDWNQASASQNQVLQTNDTLTLISRDIRSAERPNKATQAVVVADDGSTLDIYRYNDVSYERIRYRLYKENPGDAAYQLQRGLAESSDPDTSENPQYGTIGNWRTMLSGVTTANVFSDVTSIGDSERRSICISLTAADSNHQAALYSPVTISSTFMSRSQEIGGLSGGGGGAYVPTAGISLSPNILSFNKSAGSKTVTVTIYPNNASNQALDCTLNCTPGYPAWASFSINDGVITVTVASNNSWYSRSGTLNVKTRDGGWTSAVSITQSKR